MKILPYKELINMGKEALDAALATARVKSAEKKAELEIAKLEEKEATLESEITTLCSSRDLNFDSILYKLDELALVTRRKNQMNTLLADMFPKE